MHRRGREEGRARKEEAAAVFPSTAAIFAISSGIANIGAPKAV
jgi:hypothetical protein